MRQLILISIAQRSPGRMEAAAEARGMCRGMLPALDEPALDEAVAFVLRDLDLLVPRSDAVTVGDRVMVEAEPHEIADTLAYAMRFDERGRARRTGMEHAAKLAAEQLVRQLSASGFVIMRREAVR